MNIDIEVILAALIDQNEGELFLGREFLDASYAGMAIAMEYDALRDGVVMSLVKESEVTYDDNE